MRGSACSFPGQGCLNCHCANVVPTETKAFRVWYEPRKHSRVWLSRRLRADEAAGLLQCISNHPVP